MQNKITTFGIVLMLLAGGILAGAPAATAQAKSDYGLIAEWHFDEGSGSVVIDSSGNGNGGTIHGAKWVDGKYGKALEFDGTDDYVEVQDSISLDIRDEITIEGWFKTTIKDNSNAGLVSKWGTRGLSYMLWAYEGDILFDISSSIQAVEWTRGMASFANGQWHHIVATKSGTTGKIYFDGDEKANGTVSNTIISGAQSLQIGTYNARAQSSFNGFIDEVRIYNRALTADEIKTHYTEKQPALVLTKSASASTIQEAETTTISIRIENIGAKDAKAVEVTDTIPTAFKILSGSKSASFDMIKSGDYQTFEYTLKATASGKFTCDPASATYEDTDGNSCSAVSNSVSIQVGSGEVPVGADSDDDGLKDPEDANSTVPDKEKEKMPGFEAVFAIAVVLAVVYVLKSGREQ